MGRQRRPPKSVDEHGRLYDNDTVTAPGHLRWADLVPTRELPLVNPAPQAELVRPYAAEQKGTRWPR
jgi:hypothetical protein